METYLPINVDPKYYATQYYIADDEEVEES